jgi:hypothetical protein
VVIKKQKKSSSNEKESTNGKEGIEAGRLATSPFRIQECPVFLDSSHVTIATPEIVPETVPGGIQHEEGGEIILEGLS